MKLEWTKSRIGEYYSAGDYTISTCRVMMGHVMETLEYVLSYQKAQILRCGTLQQAMDAAEVLHA